MGETRGNVVMRPAKDLLSKLPEDSDKHWVKPCAKRRGDPKPLKAFPGLEVNGMRMVLKGTRVDHQDTTFVMDGTIIYITCL